jgi:hypothetical protein
MHFQLLLVLDPRLQLNWFCIVTSVACCTVDPTAFAIASEVPAILALILCLFLIFKNRLNIGSRLRNGVKPESSIFFNSYNVSYISQNLLTAPTLVSSSKPILQ